MLHPPGFTQFFGDIRQWITTSSTNKQWSITLPIALTTVYMSIGGINGAATDYINRLKTSHSNSSVTITLEQANTNGSSVSLFVIGKA